MEKYNIYILNYSLDNLFTWWVRAIHLTKDQENGPGYTWQKNRVNGNKIYVLNKQLRFGLAGLLILVHGVILLANKVFQQIKHYCPISS